MSVYISGEAAPVVRRRGEEGTRHTQRRSSTTQFRLPVSEAAPPQRAPVTFEMKASLLLAGMSTAAAIDLASMDRLWLSKTMPVYYADGTKWPSVKT